MKYWDFSKLAALGLLVAAASSLGLPIAGGEPASAQEIGAVEAESTVVLAVSGPELHPVVDNHNDREADRINLVFIGHGPVPSDETLRQLTDDLLALDGEPKVLRDVDGPFLGWGLFSIEPFLGNQHKFNFWYLGTAGIEGTGFDQTLPRSEREIVPADSKSLGLGDDVVLIVLDWSSDAVVGWATPPYYTGNLRPLGSGDNAYSELGQVTMTADRLLGLRNLVLPHELGHALFDLRDEYPASGDPYVIWPNCAQDQLEAEELWGSFVGDLDPMYNRWEAAMVTHGFVDQLLPPQDYTVGYYEGQCLGSEDSSVVRPTFDSIMNQAVVPVFGAYNRAWAERVLDHWDGTGDSGADAGATGLGSDEPVGSDEPRLPEPADQDAEPGSDERPVGAEGQVESSGPSEQAADQQQMLASEAVASERPNNWPVLALVGLTFLLVGVGLGGSSHWRRFEHRLMDSSRS